MQGRWVLAVTDAVEKEEGLLTNSGAPWGNVGGAAHDDEGTGLFRAHQREDGAESLGRSQPLWSPQTENGDGAVRRNVRNARGPLRWKSKPSGHLASAPPLRHATA